MEDQGGGEVSSEKGEPKGGNPCGEHGPEVYFFRADPIRDAGENYERDRVADLEPGDNGTGLGRRHCPFPPEHREGPRIGHEEQAIEEPRSADPGKPPVESSPFNRIRYHSLLIVIKIENQNNLSIWLAPICLLLPGEDPLSGLYRPFSELRLGKHPDKTFIGRIGKEFDFLGYNFSPERLSMAEKTIEKFLARAVRLYGQDQGESFGSPLLGLYVKRWVRSL
jgi:hypothetical protein